MRRETITFIPCQHGEGIKIKNMGIDHLRVTGVWKVPNLSKFDDSVIIEQGDKASPLFVSINQQ